MWCALPLPGNRGTVTVERLAAVQAHFGGYVDSPSVQVTAQWELPVTYIALMHRYLQTLARPECCQDLGERQRESLALNVLFGVPVTSPAAQAAAQASAGSASASAAISAAAASSSSAVAAAASSSSSHSSKTPRHLPSLLSGKSFSSLCLRSDWRVRESRGGRARYFGGRGGS